MLSYWKFLLRDLTCLQIIHQLSTWKQLLSLAKDAVILSVTNHLVCQVN